MISITRDLRKDLEKTVKQARRVAEAGARQAVQQLRVGDGDAPKDLTTEQRALRTRLRAHGRQLGDRRDAKTGAQETAHLVQECAYEHWHRMLFARFLAEAGLLIEPASGVAITLEEVQELAREKATDWLELASEYAERMLPQIFRKEDPVLQIALPPETRSGMEDLLKGLSKLVFDADDSLGWVYQFWQADKKDEVNNSETKIGADELPAVTQLFTEDYMVLFLLHNTLGAWWAGKVLASNPHLTASLADEAALRAACKVGDVDWEYLRFVRDKGVDGADGPWRPAAGSFEGWPKTAKDLTILDPCMGSGHFLVFALPILMACRMAEEGRSPLTTVDAVVKENLFGLEIDPRCTQIAAFNLAFAAWRKVGYRQLPQLNLACSGLAIGVTRPEWLKLAAQAVVAADPAAKRDLLGVEQNLLTAGLEERVKNGLEALYELFAKAPWLGSLIDPRGAGGDIFHEGFNKLEPMLASILAATDTDDTHEIAVAAKGMAKAAEILGRRFTMVATNVPYLGRSKQHEFIQQYCESNHANAKPDLSTCFVERGIAQCAAGGSIAMVTPQNWLFLGSYSKFRKSLLERYEFNLVTDLGPAAFKEMNWWAARTALVVVSAVRTKADHRYAAIRADTGRDLPGKLDVLKNTYVAIPAQSVQLTNPGLIVRMDDAPTGTLLGSYAIVRGGTTSSDSPMFRRKFWELAWPNERWSLEQTSFSGTTQTNGLSDCLLWEGGKGQIAARTGGGGATIAGRDVWGRRGVAISYMKDLHFSFYWGTVFENTICVLVPNDPAHLPAIWEFCKSGGLLESVRRINQKLSVDVGYFEKADFDLGEWLDRASLNASCDYEVSKTNDPTQWLFHGAPAYVRPSYVLQIALSRLLHYQWPAETIEGLPLSPESRSRLVGCQDLIRHGHFDADGIVCLTALKGEPPAEQRLNALLSHAFGADWSAAKLANLLAEAGYAGKSLDEWLRDGFFAQHCELFDQRPFIWHIWDGRRDGFHALINYHRLAAPSGEGRRTLEKLIYSYLGDWIDRQRADQKAGIEGADARLAHAEHLKTELIKILDGEAPYDIFVRWKPLHDQPIGWDPDISDGLRMNIRPFMTARPLNARGANACILRTAPKIKWDKDRGKETARDKTDYPWFWGWDEKTSDFTGATQFDSNRWNDLHYSRGAKQAARDRHRAPVGGEI